MRGRLIVIDGVDSSGKQTQCERIYDRLMQGGADVRKLSFPVYSQPSSTLVKMYLEGQFSKDPAGVNAYAASTFYCVDRYASYKKDWERFLRGGGIVLCDRYTTSNAIHQGSKLGAAERGGYFDWLYDFEFGKVGLPRPDLVILLDMPVDIALQLMRTRANKATGGAKKDIHEADEAYMRSCYDCALEAAAHYGWRRVSCIKGGALRSVEEINDEIYSIIKGEIDGI